MTETAVKSTAGRLEIYVKRDCWPCDRARTLAEAMRSEFPEADIALIDLSSGHGQYRDRVVAVPAYVMDGRVISLGNPDAGELRALLRGVLWSPAP